MSIWENVSSHLEKHRIILLALASALTLASAFYAPGVEFDSDPSEYFPRQEPEVKFWLDMTRRFDGMSILFIGLEEPSTPFSAEGLARLDAITKKLAEHKADGILWVRSLTNVESIREGEDGTLNAELLASPIPPDPAGLAAVKARVAADPQVTGALISRDMMGYQLLIRTDTRKDGREIARTVQRIVEEERGPLKAYYYGAPFFSNLVTSGIYSKLFYIIPAFFFLLLLPVLRGLKSFKVSLLVLLSSGVPLLWWLAMMRLLRQPLSSTSANAALFLLVAGAALFGRCAFRKSVPRTGQPVPAAVPGGLVVLALACIAISGGVIPYLSKFFFAMSVGLVVMALFSIIGFMPALSFLPHSSRQPSPGKGRYPAGLAAAALVMALVAGAFGAWSLRFYVTPQNIFSKGDEVGKVHGFFDRRFGGSDFIQIDVSGDMRDPSNLARLMRFADAVECSGKCSDTRAISQVIAFLGNGFGGIHRIPPSREALSNLWFFIEGSNDVRPMINDGRNEAMVALRIPSNPQLSAEDLKSYLEETIDRSLNLSPRAYAGRINGLASIYGTQVDQVRLEKVVATASSAPTDGDLPRLTAIVTSRLEAWMASPDSPITPTRAQLEAIRKAVAGWRTLRQDLLRSISEDKGTISGSPAEVVETLATRASDIMVSARANLLTEELLSGAGEIPSQLRQRLRGVVSELISPPAGNGADIRFHVSGFPIVSARISQVLKTGLLVAMLMLIVSFSAMLMVAGAGIKGVIAAALESAVAAVLTLSFMRVTGLQVDSSSAILALLAPMSVFFVSRHIPWGLEQADPGETSAANSVLIGFALSGLSILISGVLPAARIAVTMAAGLLIAAAVCGVSSRMYRKGESR